MPARPAKGEGGSHELENGRTGVNALQWHSVAALSHLAP